MTGRRSAAVVAAACCATWIAAGCSSPSAPPPAATATALAPRTAGPARERQAAGSVIGRNERMLLYLPAPGDTPATVAARYLGSESLAWTIGDANPGARADAGEPWIVPLKPLNPTGVTADRFQTVPILCYHRFGTTTSKMVVPPAAFEAQLEWLARNDYHVIRLGDLAGFLAGQKALPRRSVVITIDDGYESVYRHAFPLLKRYGFPATVFVYTDFLGGGDALTWAQLQEMTASGLIDIQSHSKSHRNLIERRNGESDDRYRANIEAEMKLPRELIERRLPQAQVRFIAYPFGDANEVVLESAARHGFTLGATVIPGGNGFFAQPMMLRRTMIYGDLGLEGFKAKLQVSRALSAP